MNFLEFALPLFAVAMALTGACALFRLTPALPVFGHIHPRAWSRYDWAAWIGILALLAIVVSAILVDLAHWPGLIILAAAVAVVIVLLRRRKPAG